MDTYSDPTRLSAAWTPERGWHDVTETERRAMQADAVRRLTTPRWITWTRANQNAKELAR